MRDQTLFVGIGVVIGLLTAGHDVRARSSVDLDVRLGNPVLLANQSEVGILRLLVERRGQVVGRDAFFNRLWGLDHVPNSRTLDQQIAKLRKRIEIDPKRPRLISTVHGAGYRHDG
jgi:DNA-binding response OmpR family regulator